MRKDPMKFLFISWLRATGLLALADRVKFTLGRARAAKDNERFVAENPGFLTPPSEIAFDALNHADWNRYRDSGARHAAVFARIVKQVLGDRPGLEVLEWGCGPGRIIRHMQALLPGARLTGADYNAATIEWCAKSLPGIFFANNALNPPLPFPDASFDVAYNFSVFTHLSEAVQLAWARELHRVLRPGGCLICTTHGEAYRYLLASSAERERFDTGHVVVQGNYPEGRKWFFAVHPEAFVRDHLLAEFGEVRRHATWPEDDVMQEFWAGRKAPAAA